MQNVPVSTKREDRHSEKSNGKQQLKSKFNEAEYKRWSERLEELRKSKNK